MRERQSYLPLTPGAQATRLAKKLIELPRSQCGASLHPELLAFAALLRYPAIHFTATNSPSISPSDKVSLPSLVSTIRATWLGVT